jgi:hypothetical protein
MRCERFRRGDGESRTHRPRLRLDQRAKERDCVTPCALEHQTTILRAAEPPARVPQPVARLQRDRGETGALPLVAVKALQVTPTSPVGSFLGRSGELPSVIVELGRRPIAVSPCGDDECIRLVFPRRQTLRPSVANHGQATQRCPLVKGFPTARRLAVFRPETIHLPVHWQQLGERTASMLVAREQSGEGGERT